MRFFKFLLVLLVLGAGVVVFELHVPFGPSQEVFVDIAPGTGTKAMAEQLAKAGVIRSAVAFEVMKEVHGGALKAGEYRFDHAATLPDVYERIRRGDVYTRALVIPEGYNLFEIADAVEKGGFATRADFLAAARKHTELISLWSPHAESLEGFLFPDTYSFSRHTTPAMMVAAMVRRFGQVSAKLEMTGGDVRRVVTMASLVEKEVHIDSERPLVAGVFENRLSAGMPLQTDPAVAYASMLRGTWRGVIHQSELRSDSAYNTYAHAGLPPGPICNPGLAALKAALHPAATEYLYFVADANGATRFSKDLREHDEQVAMYRQGVK